MIEIKNLTKFYGKTAAITGLSLTVQDGSVFGLVGSNGAGKSTLLRLLSGVYRADAGEILFDGVPVFENEAVKQEILYLPDEPFYAPGMRTADTAALYKTFYNFNDNVFNDYISAYRLDLKAPI